MKTKNLDSRIKNQVKLIPYTPPPPKAERFAAFLRPELILKFLSDFFTEFKTNFLTGLNRIKPKKENNTAW